ncbi:hypothetical protein H2199_003798 [Coniosporium tulheliwenetii]|uniref:Uncharacterized protein n=1 Tax=Coniosporium tulheliwenetii TaxID=3383036 RepID=A0ACC2Z868_9PEZI|nr:hypothetical protein H2199_003798 [Cladosporium sp. JES 115]
MARMKNARRTPSLEEGEIQENQTGDDHLPAQRRIDQKPSNLSGAGRKRKSTSAESSPLSDVPPSDSSYWNSETHDKSPPDNAKSGSQAKAGAAVTSSRLKRKSTGVTSAPRPRASPSVSPLPVYEFYAERSSNRNQTRQTPSPKDKTPGGRADASIWINSSPPKRDGAAAACKTPIASPLTPPPLDPVKEKANPPNGKEWKQPQYNSAAAIRSIANIIHDMKLRKSTREDRSSAPSPDNRPGIHPDRQALMARPAPESAHSPAPADSPGRSKKQRVQGVEPDAENAADQPLRPIREAPQRVNNGQAAAPEVIDLGSGSESAESQKDGRPPEVIDLVTRSGDENEGQKGGRSRDGRPSNKAGKKPDVASRRSPPRSIHKNDAGVLLARWDRETTNSAPFRPHASSLARMAKEYKAKKAQDKQKRDAEDLRRQQATDMIADELLPGHIRGAYLGQGGFGTASVWVELDKENNIVDRSVMKYCGPQDPEHPKKFDDPPTEVELLRRLAFRSEHISRLRNYSVSGDRTEYWVIMDFAPFGDLDGFCWDYASKGRNIPELFLWYIFYALVKACIVCRYGTEEPDTYHDSYTDEWSTEIVHCDLKPHNVFVGDKIPYAFDGFFGSYPAPILGDFGCAITARSDSSVQQYGGGTPGFEAPEQHPEAYPNIKHRQVPKLAWTNVWGIGAIMATLIYQADNYQQQFICYDDDGELELRVDDSAVICSDELRDLVSACLRARADERPRLDYLLSHIEENIRVIRKQLIIFGASLDELHLPGDSFAMMNHFRRRLKINYNLDEQ